MKKNEGKISLAGLFLGFALVIIIAMGAYIIMLTNELNAKEEKIAEFENEFNQINTGKNELTSDSESKDTNSQFIGINGCFLGEFSNGKWNSANQYIDDDSYNYDFKIKTIKNVNKKEFSIDDILNKKSFYLYSGKDKKFITSGNELFYDKDQFSEYYYEVNTFRFNEMSDKYNYSEHDSIETSNEIIDLHKDEITEINEYKGYEKYVKEILELNQIKEDINISKIIKCDANNDGIDEYYIIANSIWDKEKTNYDEDLLNRNSLYWLVLKIENNKTEVIMQKILNKELVQKADVTEICTNINNADLFDFNNDGKLELYVEAATWDVPEIFVFTYNEDNELELCLYGDFRW